MQFVRPVIAQYYRQGRSLGYRRSRDFSSSRGNYDDFEYPTKIGVMQYLFEVGAGLAAGSGFAYLFVGSNASDYKDLEEKWKDDQRFLEMLEEEYERNKQYYFGAKKA